MTDIAQFAVAVPVIVGLVSAIKLAGLPSRFAPLTSVVLGIGAAFLVFQGANVGETVLFGVAAGLSASGLYSGVKATATPTPEIPSNLDSSNPADPIAY